MGSPVRRVARSAAAVGAALALSAPVPAGAATDPVRAQQWHLPIIGADAGRSVGGGAGTVIAVIDSGVDLQHEDLKDRLLAGRDFTGGGTVQDDCDHGTHVAGTAAATADNGRGVTGVAPAAKVLPLRSLKAGDGTCGGNTGDVAAAIRFAADQRATVINLSLGSDLNFVFSALGEGSLEQAIRYAWSKGSIPVVAAGNERLFPSGYGDLPAIVVAATDGQDRRATFSSAVGGARWGLAAPGGQGPEGRGVVATCPMASRAGPYCAMQGTSMSTPMVAAAAAILRGRGLTAQQAVDRLLATAKDLGDRNAFGAGRLDIAAATKGLSVVAPPATAAAAPATTRAATESGPTVTTPATAKPGRPGDRTAAPPPSPNTAGSTTDGEPGATGETTAPAETTTTVPEVSAVGTPVDEQAAPPLVIDEGGSGDDGPSGAGWLPYGAGVAALASAGGAAAWRLRRRGA